MAYSSTSDIILDASRILMEEASALQACAQRLQQKAGSAQQGFESCIQVMFKALDQGGKIVVTGVGKSGKIGEKIVATMLSTGTLATFLHPVEALHGDLGVIQGNDVVLAISYSGNTEELLALVPSLKRRNVPIIGLGGNPFSKLATQCHAWLDGHVDREAGDDVPAPTTSTTLALALGDALALTLAKLRSFDTDGFALNHPGGSLGRKLLMKVQDAMLKLEITATVAQNASLDLVILEMTRHPKSAGVIVLADNDDHAASPSSAASNASTTPQVPRPRLLDDESFLWTPPPSTISSDDDDEDMADEKHPHVLGIITHGDVHRILKSIDKDHNVFALHAADIMSKHPVTCLPDTLALDALHLMTNAVPGHSLPLLPVVAKDGQCLGVVTRKDLQEFF
ncbi:hypothetical protein BC940DRAFT_308259 [Gongronella butleri]|nr:hypothetical protein BC940DRAFT_308259 [Gongronella butleri]